MLTSQYNARTYGRKGSAKRKQSIDSSIEPRKRRRTSTEPEEPTDNDEGPSTPRRAMATIARDLTDIFQSCSPKRFPATTPTKLARRMLARSKTESSIASDSSVGTTLERIPSMPSLSSSSPPDPPTPSSALVRPPVVPLPTKTNTRTYAGKSRSFLVAIPASSLDPLAADDNDDEFSTRESYASLRSRWGVDNSEDDPYPANISPARSESTSTPGGTPTKAKGKARAQQEALFRAKISLPNGMMNPLKSITELRSKGESRRFLDEVGYLFEGMDPSVGVGLRRASALEIVTKLCDPEFARKAKAADFFSRTWDVFADGGAGKGEDKILDTLLVFFVAFVAQDPSSLRDLAQRLPSTTSLHSAAESSKVDSVQRSPSMTMVDTLFLLLDVPSDPLALISSSSPDKKGGNEVELKKLGVGKKDRGMFQTIHDTIVNKSSLFPSNTQISVPLLILHTLQTLPPALIPPRYLPALIGSLRHALSPILSPSLNSTPLAWPDAARTIPFESIHCALRLLDVYLLGQWGTAIVELSTDEEEPQQVEKANEAEVEKAREEWLAEGLIALGVCAELDGGGMFLCFESTEVVSYEIALIYAASARNCMQVTFRVLVSLTHSDEAWGRKVVESECALGFIIRVITGFQSSGVDVVKKEEESQVRLGNGRGKMKVAELKDGNSERFTHALDTLCLALGLLTNLVQVFDGIKDTLREFRIDPTCKLRKRACIRSCTCLHPTNALDILIALYKYQISPSPPPPAVIKPDLPIVDNGPLKTHLKPDPDLDPPEFDADTDSDALFLRGHLAVLFGLLIQGSSANKAHILSAIDGSEKLVEHARDFAAFYDAFGGETEGRVAKEVVVFLESLKT
ncbi:hypothetical protein J132_04676 [Termitomyces sp. J132]|nr:hypothetical protein J132_04676 [Termitomyces sp. J132]